ncbi:tyrosine-type recombinase/integrase [Serratia sp. root2]|nr:tyrosine-type recombinase/integrase [Serratia sp. root2]MDT3250870.1 tyrosine-type recombinase/integrase [Serratia sp. root2]
MEAMHLIGDGSVDMVCADVPYGTTQCAWDSVIDLELMWSHLHRIAKPNAAIVLFSAQPYTSVLVNSNIRNWKTEWIWEKGNATGFLNAKKQPLRAHENILVFYRGMPTYNPQFTEGYMKNAMLLALVTAQRQGDISKMQFTDVWDGHLHVEQIKTGAKVAIPLSLHCDAIGMTLEQVITQCRDHIVSPYLVHYTHNTAMARRGGMVKANTISTSFKKIRELSGLSWDKGSPPTFHEIRSLSERVYREQKVNTKDLLGHKSQRQTDRYNDARGKEWKVVGI